MSKSSVKKAFWSKSQRAKAVLYQQQVRAQYQGVNAQLADIQEYDNDFHKVALHAANPFLSLAKQLLDLSFEGKKQRFQFITLKRLEELLTELNAAINVWNITMRSPEAKLSMNLAAFRKNDKELRVLRAWNEQQHDKHPEQLVTIADIA